MDNNIEIMEQVSETNNEQGHIQNGAPIVFMREKAIFGDRRPEKQEWLKHTEMFEALSHRIDRSHLTGLQRVNGLWRIYLHNLEDKVYLMARGVGIRGKIIPLLSTNPGRLDGENTLRIRIKDIPLSADDGIIERTLVLKGIEVISLFREKLRINNKLVNCETGARLVTIKASSLKEPLGRFITFAQFTGKVFHTGQETKKKLTCSKCLEDGHTFRFCENDWKCSLCFNFGHKKDTCESDITLDDPHRADVIVDTQNVNTRDNNTSQDNDIPAQNLRASADTTPRKARKTKKNSKSSKQTVTAGQKSINQYMSSSQFKNQTPNKGNTQNVQRSPPTPAELLNAATKKHCDHPDDDDDDDDESLL